MIHLLLSATILAAPHAYQTSAGDSGASEVVIRDPVRPADVARSYQARCGKTSYTIDYKPTSSAGNFNVVLHVGSKKVAQSTIADLSSAMPDGSDIMDATIAECLSDGARFRLLTVRARQSPAAETYLHFVLGPDSQVTDIKVDPIR